MVTPTRKPSLWAVIGFYVGGALFLLYNSYDWATSTPDELAELRTGRGLGLPGWLWVVLNYIVGIGMIVLATWAVRWRRRWK